MLFTMVTVEHWTVVLREAVQPPSEFLKIYLNEVRNDQDWYHSDHALSRRMDYSRSEVPSNMTYPLILKIFV